MALLALSELDQSAQVNPDQLVIDYTWENNVNIAPKTEVREVKISKSGQVPQLGWHQLMSYLDDTSNAWGDQISHKAMEIGARVGLVGAEIVSEVKQTIKPQSPKKIVSREGKTLKTEQKVNNSKLLTNIII